MAMNKRRSYQPSDEFRGQPTTGTVAGRGKASGFGSVNAATVDKSGSEQVDLDKKPKKFTMGQYSPYGNSILIHLLSQFK